MKKRPQGRKNGSGKEAANLSTRTNSGWCAPSWLTQHEMSTHPLNEVRTKKKQKGIKHPRQRVTVCRIKVITNEKSRWEIKQLQCLQIEQTQKQVGGMSTWKRQREGRAGGKPMINEDADDEMTKRGQDNARMDDNADDAGTDVMRINDDKMGRTQTNDSVASTCKRTTPLASTPLARTTLLTNDSVDEYEYMNDSVGEYV